MRFAIALLAALAAVGWLAPAQAATPETWPSLRAAAAHLAGLLVRDLRDWPNLTEPVCVVQAADADGDADTRVAVAAVGVALEGHSFHTVSSTEGPPAAPLPIVRVATRSLSDCRILRVRLGGHQYQAVHVHKDWVDGTVPPGWIKVNSEMRWDGPEARAEAERRLLDQLVAGALVQARSGLSDEDLHRHFTVLVTRPDVRRDEFLETIVKPYGVRYRQHLLVQIPEATFQHWLDNLSREYRSRWQQRCDAAALTLAGWLGGLWLVIRVDRWTHGYRRPVLLIAALLILLTGTGCLWAIVWQF